MPFHAEQQNRSDSSSAVLKIIVLTLFAVVTAVVAVSFAANHMRAGFEKEYRSQVNLKTEQFAAASSLLINGDEITADPVKAQTKYANILPAIMVDSMEKNQSRKLYALYAYNGGALTPLLKSSDTGILAAEIPISDWLTAGRTNPYILEKDGQYTVLTPIKDSQNKVVGLFELSSTYSFLDSYGNSVERRVLMSVLVAVTAGIFLFSLQYLIPEIVHYAGRRKGRY